MALRRVNIKPPLEVVVDNLKERMYFMYYTNYNLKTLRRVFDQDSRNQYLRLDLNENPGGLPKEFVESVLKEITPQLIAEYPETSDLIHVLARNINAEDKNICLTNGSAEAIRYIIEAFTSVNGKILGVVPTYAMYEVYSNMYGRNFESIPYTKELKMPIEKIIEKMTTEVQLLILLNPNNPMGNIYSVQEFEQILEYAKKMEITILIDEAYHYFYPETFIRYALEEEHVFLTRTFSKMFSMAGVRLGYVVGKKDGIEMIQKLCTPHNINIFAKLFAKRILEQPELVQKLIDNHKEGRNYLLYELENNGYEYYGQTGNFIFIKPKHNAIDLVKKMKEEKQILIKSYNNVGKYGDCLRVTTGEKKYMEQFLEALFELDR